jgi:PAS domain S-box-containing protein
MRTTPLDAPETDRPSGQTGSTLRLGRSIFKPRASREGVMLTRHFAVLATVLLVGIFLASLELSAGYSVNTLYLFPILLAIWVDEPRTAFRVAVASTLLLATATFVRPPAVSIGATVFSRSVIAINIWLAAFVVVRYRQSQARQRADATARAAAESALRRSDKNLEDMRYALDQSAIVATTDVDGAITYVNDKFCEIAGYARDELIGRTHRVLNSGLHPPDLFRDMYETITAGQAWRGELRNRARDGRLYWVDTTIVPFLDDRGRPYQYTAIQSDITERKRSEAALRDQEALAQLGKMAAIVAHEVRNPLAGIRGAMQVVGRRLAASTPEHAIAREVVARVDTLNGIVEDLLLFARPRQPVMTAVPIATIIADTVSLFAQDPRVAAVGVRIEPTSIVVQADAEQLKLALLNLLQNGAQAMRGRGTIAIATTTAGEWHELRITDQGDGIPDAVRAHLFEPFFTTRHHGTGLGLVTARRVIEAHGGSVTLDPAPGGGTVAVVRLPAR